MKHIVKQKISSRLLLTLVMAGVLVLSLAVYLIVHAVIAARTDNNSQPKKDPPEIMEGEALYHNTAVAYPVFEESDITSISVRNEKGSFHLLRSEQDNNCMILYYTDEDGNDQVYYPEICMSDPNFSYESLYATESVGYGRAYRITYLAVALEALYFEERIPLPEDTAERAALLEEYGLLEEQSESVVVRYKVAGGDADSEDTEGAHRIKIGDGGVSGQGYYYMVDDRPYVYFTNSTYLDYARQDFSYYINPRLVAEGLTSDSTYEPYLTTDFREWMNTVHKDEGATVPADALVVLRAQMMVPLITSPDYIPGAGAPTDGYDRGRYETVSLDLSRLASDPAYARLIAALAGKGIGIYFDTEDAAADPLSRICVTLTSDSRTVPGIEEGETPVYSYTVKGIEAILTDAADLCAPGTPVGEHSLIRVTYTYTVDGEPAHKLDCHGVLDLSDRRMPADAVAALRALSVGELAAQERVTFSLAYDTSNTVARHMTQTVTDIVEILDQNGRPAKTVAEDCVITYRYYYTVDGEMRGKEESITVDLAEISDEDREKYLPKFLGRGTGKGQNFVLDSFTAYCEIVSDFLTYNIAEIQYFVTGEMISAFRFINPSERDPFYGETFYQNCLENGYRIYGMNASSCESVVRVLGGVGDNSNTSAGLVGSETVAVGLTPAVMEKYGLYAHTVYFELPRGIIGTSEDNGDELDEYDWLDTLGFMLYISDLQPDGTRYVGSDMYDIVARVDGEKFLFLDYGFVEFWARRNLILTDIDGVEELRIQLNMEDVYGDYTFTLTPCYYVGSKCYFSLEEVEGMDYVERLWVTVRSEGECMETEYSKYLLTADGTEIRNGVSLNNLYNAIMGEDGKPAVFGNDYAGTGYFKEQIELMYFTQYAGILTEEEQRQGLENAPLLMTMSVRLSSSAYRYVYEFYRVADRRVMVRIYQADDAGNIRGARPVSDFYISTLGFKKIVTGYLSLLNGAPVSGEDGYGKTAILPPVGKNLENAKKRFAFFQII